ncbi:MFS transporter [Thermococcus sp. AM4]|uniref:MFS transporter n=1 Tax=Thermococcus sp. (strain AM4) TaxID=246969 RepID=UPI00018707C1|nr:MFS transporter [Thermococcus sp. AM4]EEB74317.1 permease, major facilitator superfamily [Thermococcus sp. AM4]
MNVTRNGETYDLSYAKKAALVVVLLPLLVMYTEAMLTPALPTIQKEFAINPNDVSWVLTIYLLVGTVSVAVFGKLGDMYGKKKMFLVALGFYTLGVILNGFAPSFRWLLFSRAIQGFGMAIFPLAFSLVREEFPPEMVPQVQGMISAMFGVGMVIALPLGAYVTQHWGWRWTYHTAAPFAVLMFILAWKILRESRYINPGKLDWQGALLLVWAVVPALVAVTRAPNVGWTARETLVLFAVSIVGAVLLVLWEKRAENPIIPLDIVTSRNPAIVNLGIMFAAFGISMMSQANTYIFQMKPPYGFGKSILDSGLLMTPMAGVMLVIAPLAGKLMPKIGAKPLAITGALIASSGLAVLAKYAPQFPPNHLWAFVAMITYVGAGITLMNISFINVLVFSVPQRVMGVATGANSLFRNFGSTWGPAIAGTVMSTYYTLFHPPGAPSWVKIKIPTTKAYEVLFGTSAGIYLFLAILSLAIVEVMKGGKIRGVENGGEKEVKVG